MDSDLRDVAQEKGKILSMNTEMGIRSICIALAFFCIWSSPALAAKTTPPLDVAVKGNLVNAQLNNAALAKVLAALGKPLGFTAHIDPALSANSITETFKDLPSDKALDRLLRGMNYALAGSKLFVWPRDGKSGTLESSPEDWTVVESEEARQEEEVEEVSVVRLQVEVEQAPDPEARLAALEDLLTHGWEEGEGVMVPTLVTALQDEEPDVRTLALEGLYGIEEPESQDAISDAVMKMAEADPLPEHRVQALVWLTERNPEEAKVLLEHTLADNDPDMRAFAAGLLEEFEAFAQEENE